MNDNIDIKFIVSIAADIITISGLVWAAIFGLINKHKSLIGRQINDFVFSMFKLGVISFIAILIVRLCYGIFLFMMVLTKGETQGQLWEEGFELAYLGSYFIVITIGGTVFWLLSTVIWTGSFKYIIRIWNKNGFSNLELEIISAKYGTIKNSIDVTEILKNMIRNNKLTVTASNKIDGDPDNGKVKKLEIEYRYGNAETKSTVIMESDTKTIEY